MSSDPAYLKPHDFAFCLAHVVEECGEVLAAAGKTQRWGRDSVDPTLKEQYQETNEKWLLRELTDLEEAIVRLRTVMGPKKPYRGCDAMFGEACCSQKSGHEGQHTPPHKGLSW